jgi:hypothetical protein
MTLVVRRSSIVFLDEIFALFRMWMRVCVCVAQVCMFSRDLWSSNPIGSEGRSDERGSESYFHLVSAHKFKTNIFAFSQLTRIPSLI